MAKYRISGVPIVNEANKLVGILTNRDLRFVHDYSIKIKEVMTQERSRDGACWYYTSASRRAFFKSIKSRNCLWSMRILNLKV